MPVASPVGSAAFPGATFTPPPPASGNPVYVARFETGTGTSGAAAFPEVRSLQESTTGRISRATSVEGGPPLEGAYSAKILNSTADAGVAGATAPLQRTEMLLKSFSDVLGGGSLEGRDIWVAWTYFLRADFVFGTWIVITQFHAGYGSPLFSWAMTADAKVEVDVRGGALVTGSGAAQSRYYTVQSPALLGVAQRVKVHMKFSTGTAGFCDVWLNDTRVVHDVGLPTLLVGYESAPYHKAGIYRGGPAAESCIYYDNIRWALAEADLGG